MSSTVRGIPFLVAGLLAAVSAVAQAPNAAAPASTPSAAAVAGAATPAAKHPMVERRIAELRARLKITPSEERPFTEFAQVMRDNADRMEGLLQQQRKNAATQTAVDQMQAYGQLAQAHAEDMQRLAPAFSRLYDALSPDQKKLADQSFRDFSAGMGRPRR